MDVTRTDVVEAEDAAEVEDVVEKFPQSPSNRKFIYDQFKLLLFSMKLSFYERSFAIKLFFHTFGKLIEFIYIT